VTLVVPLALGGLALLLMAGFTMLSARKRHKAIVAPAAVVGPRVLIHDINDDRCTGCDACVAVYPTNVLDLVSNKSRVLRFQDCVNTVTDDGASAAELSTFDATLTSTLRSSPISICES